MENNLQKFTTIESEALGPSIGTSNKGRFSGYKFIELFAIFGNPTHDKPSGDDKCQISWEFVFNGDIFTIYDWATFDRLYTLAENEVWYVGGKTNATDFIEHVLQLLNNNRK